MVSAIDGKGERALVSCRLSVTRQLKTVLVKHSQKVVGVGYARSNRSTKQPAESYVLKKKQLVKGDAEKSETK